MLKPKIKTQMLTNNATKMKSQTSCLKLPLSKHAVTSNDYKPSILECKCRRGNLKLTI